MKAVISSSRFEGDVNIPSSKSYTHRLLIAGCLYNYIHNEKVIINKMLECDDSIATIEILKQLGFEISVVDDTVSIDGFNKKYFTIFDCNASGSTARFFIPLLSFFYDQFKLVGIPKLIERLNTSDLTDLKGLKFQFEDGLSICGKLDENNYQLSQKNTTQLISGMLFLMVLNRTTLEVEGLLNPYILMTLDCLKRFGFLFDITTKNNLNIISLSKINKIQNRVFEVEGDYSNASYFINIKYLGNNISINNLNEFSIQGDKIYPEYLNEILIKDNPIIDITLTPDLGPALFSFCSVSNKRVVIKGIEKLYLKESNRVDCMIKNLTSLGAEISVRNNEIIITGKQMLLGGVEVDSFGDHRVVMALASIASHIQNPFVILNCESINKSYPNFFKDYINISGNVKVEE